MSSGGESPRRTPFRTVVTLPENVTQESKPFNREPHDTSARGADGLLHETVLPPTQPFGGRTRLDRRRAGSAAGAIAQATQGYRRLVAHPPVSSQTG